MQGAGERWTGIDALRGVSVVLVVLHHVHPRFVLRKFPVRELWPKPLARVLFWSDYHAVIALDGLGQGLGATATAWLRASGRSSCETYLSHTFVVFGSMRGSSGSPRP